MAVARRSWSRLALHSIRQNTVTPREAVPNRISSTTLRSTNIIVPVRPMSSSTTNTTLAHESCVPCRKTAPKLTDGEVESGLNVTGGPEEPYSLAAQGWTVIEAQPGERALHKKYFFRNFRTALAFTNVIGRIAEEQKHHPRLITEWGSVEVDWWTHSIGGLHHNDFVMAAKTEALSQGADGIKP